MGDTDFREKTRLGRTGLAVSRLGIGASYGVGAAAIEEAFHDYGVNYFYWGSMRRGGMKKAIRNLLPTHRDELVIALQSYDRSGILMKTFHERGLKSLGIERADVLILGWHNQEPAERILSAALKLKEEGKVRYIAMSGHHRPLFGELAGQDDSPIDIFMVRYNAAHPGAEQDIFPHIGEGERPGVTAYTATCWGKLLKPGKMPDGEAPMTASECYRFALSNPLVDLCMTGPADDEQMREALRTLKDGPLSHEDMDRVRRIGAHVHG
jgi:aryl-alcohol dehydrogenase-like predicted oxidoreductase